MVKVSFIIIAYNAESHLNDLLSDVRRQTFPHDKVEIILVDSCSSDGTKKLFQEFEDNNDFYDCKVLSNPKKVLPAGWNVALDNADGEIIVRVDAHARIPDDFIEANVRNIDSGEDIVGGQRITIFDNTTRWKGALAAAESSAFGSGIAVYRRKFERGYTKTLAHAAYKKSVFDTVGRYNEALKRTEDNDMHYRMRKAGFKLCMCDDIVSYHHVRSSLRAMLKQKFFNGYWIGLTLSVQPRCFSLYNFVPFGFFMALILCGLFCFVSAIPLIALLALYFTAAILYGLKSLTYKSNRHFPIPLFPIFFLMHIFYGIGTLIGIISIPRFKHTINKEV